jgi:hypothetical protein
LANVVVTDLQVEPGELRATIRSDAAGADCPVWNVVGEGAWSVRAVVYRPSVDWPAHEDLALAVRFGDGPEAAA